MPLDIVSISPNYSPRAYTDEETGQQITSPVGGVELCEHRFSVSPAGELLHYMDGELRAIVPPEGWQEYALTWPACADLIAQLRT